MPISYVKQTPWYQTLHWVILARMPKRVIKPKASDFEQSLRGTLALNIRRFRFEQKVSQEELAFRCGLDRTYISAVERCIWNVSLSNIEKIAEALGVEPWQLLFLTKQA
jgi:ribosome-binding protein aMBF1 (putative translation factor)